MSTHVHRDGAHQITVQDDAGREVALISQDRTLRITTTGAGPHLTPQMAHDLADELHHWANCQQTVRGTNRTERRRGSASRPEEGSRSAPVPAASGLDREGTP